ncbi:MAG: DEAD/DEAH box helicase [Acidimicrobiales bacterium]
MGALDRFSPATRAWFERTFAAPTPAQTQGWAAISTGAHTLLSAPTGSGKTLAAFLWALDRLATSPQPSESGRLRVVYVSPLKALTYDVERNLRSPLAGLALEFAARGEGFPPITVGTRTGDTPANERRQLTRRPPDILVTTPESLYLLLTSAAAAALTGVQAVIVDEIHAVAATKRGAHLALSLERLERVVERPPQRIGLSATQRPLEEVARFLGGREADLTGPAMRPRPVTIVDAGAVPALDLEVMAAVDDMGQLGRPILDAEGEALLAGPAAGAVEARHSIWPSIGPLVADLIRRHRSTLVFVNSRRLAERMAHQLNELAAESDQTDDEQAANGGRAERHGGDIVLAHHGSVAREQRLEIEDSLKAGRLPGLVATSSLELGIDMGAIDLVVQIASPPSVSSGLQRIGRAGHHVGAPSVGRIIPKFRGDLVSAAVVARLMSQGGIEPLVVPRNPLDVLAQQIVAMVSAPAVTPRADPGPPTLGASDAPPPVVTVDGVAAMAAGAYPFADLSRELLEGVLDMLAGRYPSDDFAGLAPRINWDRLTGVLTPRNGSRMLSVISGGTIPDRGLFAVFTPPPDGHRVGELDEEMVYECRVGETFVLGASTWRIAEITRDRVIVIPAPGEVGKTPFWHGDNPGRPVALGRAIGEFLAEVDQWSDPRLAAECHLDPRAVTNLRSYLAEEMEATGALPTHRQIVVERFRDELGDWRICILSSLGGRVHAPWALAIEALARQRLGLEVSTMWSDEGLVVRLPEADELPPMDALLPDPDEVEDLVVGELANSALFASRFRENAARALLLPRRRPGTRTPLWQQRQRSADLLAVASRHPQFPIVLETYRECLRDVFALDCLIELLGQIRSREVRVVAVDTATPSPFAASLASSYVAGFLYEGDVPLAERRAQALTLDRRLLAELCGTDELRDLISAEALEALEAELTALDSRRRARNADEAWDLLVRLGDLNRDELADRSTGDFADVLLTQRRAVAVRVAGDLRLIAATDAGRYRDSLGTSPPPGLPDAYLESVPNALGSLLVRWARSQGPFVTAQPAARFGLGVGVVESELARLATAGSLVAGGFRPGGHGPEWCHPDVLRTLRQRSLAALRAEIEPTEADALARFLPAWQGVGSGRAGLERLHEVVRQLQGLPLVASVLEADILPARVGGYRPAMLDELASSGEVVWVGAGALGRDDGRVVLLLRDGAPALRPTPPAAVPDDPEHHRIRAVLGQRGACFFRDLAGADDRVAADALWDLVWAGEVTNDSFAALRSFLASAGGIGSGAGGNGGARPAGWAAVAGQNRTGRASSRRPRLGSLRVVGPPRVAGRWSLVDRELGTDFGGKGDRDRTWAEVLLDRHGILTRDAIRGEGVPGGFTGLYSVLRALEEAGRARRGYFVAGLGGAQFALPGAVDRLRDRPSPQSPALVLAASDPANPFGATLPWPRRPDHPGGITGGGAGEPAGPGPDGAGSGKGSGTTRRGGGPRRVAGAYVVTVNGEACLYLERGGRALLSLRPLDGTWEPAALAALAAHQSAGRALRISLERFDPGLTPALAAAGFVPTPRGLARYGS